MAGTDPCTCISMKVLVERNGIAPVRVALKHRVGAKHGPAALLVPQKDTGEAACELLCDLPQGQLRASAGGILHRSEEHTSELQSHSDLVCRLLLEKKKRRIIIHNDL